MKQTFQVTKVAVLAMSGRVQVTVREGSTPFVIDEGTGVKIVDEDAEVADDSVAVVVQSAVGCATNPQTVHGIA